LKFTLVKTTGALWLYLKKQQKEEEEHLLQCI